MATSAFPTGIAWIDPAGKHALVVGLVLGIHEDASLHPVGTLAVASVTILALGRLEITQVLKHHDGGPLRFGKLDNASTYQMRDVLICMSDLAPEVDVVLFTFGYDAGLASVASDPS